MGGNREDVYHKQQQLASGFSRAERALLLALYTNYVSKKNASHLKYGHRRDGVSNRTTVTVARAKTIKARVPSHGKKRKRSDGSTDGYGDEKNSASSLSTHQNLALRIDGIISRYHGDRGNGKRKRRDAISNVHERGVDLTAKEYLLSAYDLVQMAMDLTANNHVNTSSERVKGKNKGKEKAKSIDLDEDEDEELPLIEARYTSISIYLEKYEHIRYHSFPSFRLVSRFSHTWFNQLPTFAYKQVLKCLDST